ncbi:MAG TPA: hypothetical protein PKC47_02030 [Petrimonas sp.]|nr:hypothetical protein [Petrimonas sp.]
MANKTKAYYEDYTFKQNQTVDFIEFKPIMYHVINENVYDSVLLSNVYSEMERHNEMMKMLISKLKNEINSAKILSSLDDDVLSDIANDDIEEAREKLKKEMGKSELIRAEDSLIQLRISNRENPEVMYSLKTFVKASVKEKSGELAYNVLDTIYTYFDKDLHIREIPDYFILFDK